MKRLKFVYSMRLNFSAPVSRHFFSLCCVPGDSFRQKIILSEKTIGPADYLHESVDGFGNARVSGCMLSSHCEFGYRICGMAQTQGMVVEPEPLHPMYRYPSFYTQYDSSIVEFSKAVEKIIQTEHAESNLQKAIVVMEYLYEHFEYMKGVTTVQTTAAEALQLSRGVCQDYAHIMIAVLRYLKVPARYVCGLMIGEGTTHAWVEIYTDGGWYGLDPTNRLHIDEYYIKLAHGRDYRDCQVSRGCFWGTGLQHQEIYAYVEEMKDD